MEIYRELYQISKSLSEFTQKAKRLHKIMKQEDWQERIDNLCADHGTSFNRSAFIKSFIQSLLDHKDKQLDAAINGTLSILNKPIPRDMVIRQAEMFLEQLKQSL